MTKPTVMSLERGVLFFEDGTEVSNVSVEMIQALPDMLNELEKLFRVLKQESEGYTDEWDDPENPLYEDCKRLAGVIAKAKGDPSVRHRN